MCVCVIYIYIHNTGDVYIYIYMYCVIVIHECVCVCATYIFLWSSIPQWESLQWVHHHCAHGIYACTYVRRCPNHVSILPGQNNVLKKKKNKTSPPVVYRMW